MAAWLVTDLMESARALHEAPDSFVKRRVMQRVDDESLSIPEATAILRDLVERQEVLLVNASVIHLSRSVDKA